METFNDFIFRATLIKPPSLRDTWTWCNETQARARIYEHIDRCFTNSIAMVQYPISVMVLTRYRSDHAPLLILPYEGPDTPRPPFRFQTMWLEYEGFLPFVRRHWIGHIGSSHVENFSYRLCNLKLHFKWWNRHIFGNINTQVDILERDLGDVERKLQIQWTEYTWE